MASDKKKLAFAVTIIALSPILIWILFPQNLPFMSRMWILLGRPDLLHRIEYFGIFCIVVIVLSICLLKPYPR